MLNHTQYLICDTK